MVPHLTVGHGIEGSNLRDVERQVLPHLPIHMEVTTAGLWAAAMLPGRGRRWLPYPWADGSDATSGPHA